MIKSKEVSSQTSKVKSLCVSCKHFTSLHLVSSVVYEPLLSYNKAISYFDSQNSFPVAKNSPSVLHTLTFSSFKLPIQVKTLFLSVQS